MTSSVARGDDECVTDVSRSRWHETPVRSRADTGPAPPTRFGPDRCRSGASTHFRPGRADTGTAHEPLRTASLAAWVSPGRRITVVQLFRAMAPAVRPRPGFQPSSAGSSPLDRRPRRDRIRRPAEPAAHAPWWTPPGSRWRLAGTAARTPGRAAGRRSSTTRPTGPRSWCRSPIAHVATVRPATGWPAWPHRAPGHGPVHWFPNPTQFGGPRTFLVLDAESSSRLRQGVAAGHAERPGGVDAPGRRSSSVEVTAPGRGRPVGRRR